MFTKASASSRLSAPMSMNRCFMAWVSPSGTGWLAKTPCTPLAKETRLARETWMLMPPRGMTLRKPSFSISVTTKPIWSMWALNMMRFEPGLPSFTAIRLPITSVWMLFT